MKRTLLILTISVALTVASPVATIQSPTILDSLSQLLYLHLNPVFQKTLQQLLQLTFEFGDQLGQYLPNGSARSNPMKPAPWVSQMFGEMNEITSEWNHHITQFFGNIPTIFEKNGRSVVNFPLIKEGLHLAVQQFLQELQRLFLDRVNPIFISGIEDFDLTEVFNGFRQRITAVFDKTKEQLTNDVDKSIDLLSGYWNDLKASFLG